MELAVQDQGDATLITVSEERIDAAVAINFKEKLRERTQNTSGRVVLDMRTVNFLDSSGLGAVVAAMKQLGPNRKLELAGLTPTVEKVFKLTRMDTVFTIHDSAEDAFAGSGNVS